MPHCIQILCIFRLLSVHKDSKGVDKHLAQVSTGQGKSVILGLISSLLALTVHKVRTVCYSEYLATQDQQDFDNFFENFGIRDKITYSTFDEMANEVIMPEVNGKRQGLRELSEGRILRTFDSSPLAGRGEGVPSHRARRSSHRAPLPAAYKLNRMFTFCRSTRNRRCQSR